ncbi:Rab-GAP TBC domain-containing protein [Caenorhabditis elegans]|uniref:Rab-GAP TBC domain-containing protein n=1 Tax=Caenorhabditis elegans TaxID=6239 RepID=O44873_CAEEL|nr:Rab-GAP TBC domain-containing protein [Caenorhabditis elegans]CCD73248.1 Rab-GAP TBC domain-containing protein [Caenorhabditis elegans]|eukprot:NP_497310.2 TBC (Tre-2/Bub2/Cdc16) domain family [Caenorhabditis elegans]
MQISSTSSNGNYANIERMTVSCPPETFDETVPLKQIKKELTFVIERPEKPGETSSHHGSKRSSVCYEGDEEYDNVDDDVAIAENRHISENLEHFEEPVSTMRAQNSVKFADNIVENHPETDRFGFFTIQNKCSTPPIDSKILRRREKKWIQMLDNWRYFMDEKFELVKNRCRKGIPPSLRGRAWKYLSGATYQMEVSSNRFVFDYCVKQAGDPKWNDDIQKDLSRQFPEHEMFARVGKYGNNGKNDLFDLLKAWTILHPEEGYCQGQAPIAAVLLMHMPVRDAFYCFVQICHKYLPGYYSSGLEAVQTDGDILTKLIKDRSKLTYRHFKANGVDPALYMIEWFMCCFCRTLPWPTVLRVWDMFLCEGVKILFKVALVLLKFGIGTPSQIKQYPDMPAIVTRLRNLPVEIMEEEFLVQKISETNLNDADMEKLHFGAMKTRQMRFD